MADLLEEERGGRERSDGAPRLVPTGSTGHAGTVRKPKRRLTKGRWGVHWGQPGCRPQNQGNGVEFGEGGMQGSYPGRQGAEPAAELAWGLQGQQMPCSNMGRLAGLPSLLN